MKRYWLLLAFALISVMALFISPALAQGGLVRTTWPSAEDPGPPFYARIEPAPPHVYSDGEWAAIVFYRDPGCVPGGFNLLSFFDAPAAFGCPLTVHGASLWQGAALSGAPKIVTSSGDGEVPVWFAPVGAIQQALQDNVLTIGELAGLAGLLVGHADHLNETLHPAPLPPELGGGGHPNPKLILNAHGTLEDGRRFKLHITTVNDEVRAIQIQFR